jgi:hypothetical protein
MDDRHDPDADGVTQSCKRVAGAAKRVEQVEKVARIGFREEWHAGAQQGNPARRSFSATASP